MHSKHSQFMLKFEDNNIAVEFYVEYEVNNNNDLDVTMYIDSQYAKVRNQFGEVVLVELRDYELTDEFVDVVRESVINCINQEIDATNKLCFSSWLDHVIAQSNNFEVLA